MQGKRKHVHVHMELTIVSFCFVKKHKGCKLVSVLVDRYSIIPEGIIIKKKLCNLCTQQLFKCSCLGQY